jgi:hypothetical protein
MKPLNFQRIGIIVLFTILGVLASCKTVPTVVEPKPSTGTSSVTLNSVVDHTEDSVESIKNDAMGIKKDTRIVREALSIGVITESLSRDSSPTEAPKPSDVAVDTLAKIDAKAENISQSAEEIRRETERLKTLSEEVETLERSLTSLRLMLEETRVKAMEKLYSYISMFWVIGFVLIAAGAAVAFFLNKTYGGSLAMLGVLMLGFASASQYYMEEIALVGAILLIVGFVASIAMIVWSTIKSKRNSTAIHEVVEMIEILKETMTDSEKERIFGTDGLASKVQSDLTMQIIAKIKERNGFRKLSQVSPSDSSSQPQAGQEPTPPPSTL